MSKVNREAVAEWVAALRSGDYTQTKNQLGKVNPDGSVGYCCLGVACELFTERLKLDREAVQPSGKVYFNDDWTVLPYEVMSHLGFDALNPKVDYAGHDVSLAELNDDHGKSFGEIADLIEATYLADEGE